jgi:hypothetical protein
MRVAIQTGSWPKIECWLADDAVRCEPLSGGNFPDQQGKNREFHHFEPLRASFSAENPEC